MCTGDFRAWLFDNPGIFASRWESLVKGETDGLYRDIISTWLFQERAQNSSGDIATATNRNDQIRLEGREDLRGRGLAELVNLSVKGASDGIVHRKGATAIVGMGTMKGWEGKRVLT